MGAVVIDPAPLRRAKPLDAPVILQLARGDAFDVLELAGGDAWGVAVASGLVGYVDRPALRAA